MSSSPPPPSSPPTATAAAEPPASGPGDAEPKCISLNVRTLDHATYPISIGSNASVLQLKEIVALETGVVFARQRLIFRGRVLKNDQSIAAYALEDGHTLHLVARAADSAEASASNSSSNSNASDPVGAPAAPRNNDEPDPTLGGGGGGGNGATPQVVVGLQDGAAVNMPFLTHMIANIMTSAHGAIPSGHIVISDVDLSRDGVSSYAHFMRPASAPVGIGAVGAAAGGGTAAARREEARARRRSELRASGGSTGAARARGGAGATAAGNMTSGLGNLRARSEQLLGTVRVNVENAEYDLTGLEETQLEATGDTDAAFLQTQLTQLEILLEHFRTRLHLLPVALQEVQRRSTTPSAQSQLPTQPSVSAIVRTIDTLQNVGESVDILARLARYLFIRHNPGFTGGSIRLNEGDSVGVASGSAGGGTSISVNAATTSAGAEAVATTRSTNTFDSALRTARERVRPSHRRRHANSRSDASRGSGDPRGGNALFSLLERMNESIRGATGDLTVSGAASSTSTAPSSSPVPASTSVAQEESGSARAPPVVEPPQFSMANLGLPLGSMVFPISFTDLNSNTTTTWNFAELVNRVASEVPTSTLFNVISGEPVAIHHVMAQIGYALASGMDVPPVSRATIRTWSHSFATELRQQLRSRGVPAEVLEHLEASRQVRFVDNLIRPLEPFVPDLVDLFLRATSASRTAAFGSSSIDFLSTMSRQFVRHMRTYVGGDDETLRRVLQSLAEYLGLDARLAAFAVANFLDWAGSRRRALDNNSASAESGPANKRRREG